LRGAHLSVSSKFTRRIGVENKEMPPHKPETSSDPDTNAAASPSSLSAFTPEVRIEDALREIEESLDGVNSDRMTLNAQRELQKALRDFAPKKAKVTKLPNRAILALFFATGLLCAYFSDNIFETIVAFLKPRSAPRAETLTLAPTTPVPPPTTSIPVVQQPSPADQLINRAPAPKTAPPRPTPKRRPRAYMITTDDVWDNNNTVERVAHMRGCPLETLRKHLKSVWEKEKLSSAVLMAGTVVPLPPECVPNSTKP
jgi:hypothetical protein